MKHISICSAFLTALSVFSLSNVQANNVNAVLKTATLFFQGAELTCSATASLAKGENEVIIGGLSPYIDQNSLKIKVSNGVIVSASEFSTDYLTKPATQLFIKQLQDSIEQLTAAVNTVTTQIKLNKSALELLQKGMESNMSLKEKSLPVVEMTAQLDFFKTKALSYEKAITDDINRQEKLNTALTRLKKQLQQEQGKNGVNTGVLKLALVAPAAVSATFTVSYFTPAARWIPYYDINVASVDKPIKLISRAKVSQTTGISWEKVALTLSSATPSRNRVAPLFETWFLNFYTPRALSAAPAMNSLSYDRNKEESMELAPTVQKTGAVNIRGIGEVNHSIPPLYIVNGVPYEGDVNQLAPNMIKSVTVLKKEEATELYGTRGANGVILITLKDMEDFIIAEEKNLNMEYAIALPYTVPGNGKEQIVDLKTSEVSATYSYYVAPKLDANVFLIAEIAEWEKLNLLSGMANITYDGTYIGQTYLNAASTDTHLSLTLGTDQRISVKREKITDFSSVKTLAADTKVTLSYRITVKNNQNKPVNVTLKEQYPISSQKTIIVELLTKETTPPAVNRTDIGVLTWETLLKEGETKVYQITFSVQYPKGTNINL
jgi:TonB-dependent SusC/RagA subfamily outer membrane receptor